MLQPVQPAAARPLPAATTELLRPSTVEIDFSQTPTRTGSGTARRSSRSGERGQLAGGPDRSGTGQDPAGGHPPALREGLHDPERSDQRRGAVEKATVQVKATDTARRLFKVYEFPKTAEGAGLQVRGGSAGPGQDPEGGHLQAGQAEAKFQSAHGKYNIERIELEELKDQLAKTRIHATKTGPGDLRRRRGSLLGGRSRSGRGPRCAAADHHHHPRPVPDGGRGEGARVLHQEGEGGDDRDDPGGVLSRPPHPGPG